VKKKVRKEQDALKSDDKKRLTYKLQRELQMLPDKIEKIQKDIDEMNDTLSDGDFYQRDPDGFHETTQRLARVMERLKQAEERWFDLEEQRLALEA